MIVDYTNLLLLSFHKLCLKMSYTYGNHTRNYLQRGLSNLDVQSYL